MRFTIPFIHLLLSFLVRHAAAQILTTGNTRLPACAANCALLNQAAQACGGATTSSQGTWICFCQSAYLRTLYTTPVGVCDAFCPDPAQNALVQTWYKSECGTDNGASEHPAGGQAPANPGTTTTTGTPTTTATGTANTVSGTAAAGTFTPIGVDPVEKGSWWANHSKWVIMLIILSIGLALLTVLLVWLKRRHNRKQDAMPGSFNEGITTRSTPMTTVSNPVPVYSSSGRDSPARTRDAFMPYGYGYSRSESRLGSRTNVADPYHKGSPLAQDSTTLAQLEKDMGGSSGKKKRVFVRERSISGRESPELRK